MTSPTSTTSLPEPGTVAPDFELPDDQGNPRRLADARGKWLVLYFYPKDDTPGCTTQACQFRDALPRFDKLDAVAAVVTNGRRCTRWTASSRNTRVASSPSAARAGMPWLVCLAKPAI